MTIFGQNRKNHGPKRLKSTENCWTSKIFCKNTKNFWHTQILMIFFKRSFPFLFFSAFFSPPRCSVRTTSAGALPLSSWFYVGWHPMLQKRQRLSRCLSYIHSAGLYPAGLCLLLRNRIPLFIAFMRRSSMCGFISPPAPYPAGLTEGVSKLLPPLINNCW